MSTILSPLPPVDHPNFDALLAELPEADVASLRIAAPLLGPLLEAAPYLLELTREHSGWLAEALNAGPDVAVAALLADVAKSGRRDDEAGVGALLRAAKGRTALLAAVAETGGAWSTARATESLSDLADAALEAALDLLMRQAFEKGQLAIPAEAATAANCGLAIFALGKHGGRELNYSSDIDIVAFFDPQKPVLADPSEATKIYSRMVQKLVGLMEDRLVGGYVFRTDLRLRPDPGSTPVAISVDAALAYYEVRGQNWERAAWIKSRPCAGDKAVGEAFLKELAPYVWRKHLDFATIADIQAMKRQINVSKKVGDIRVEGHNVKLGRGGIREIEFFAQTQQLIAGGRDKALRVRPTAEALAALAAANWISPTTAEELTETYWFLRAVENRLQMLRDEQTHIMPDSADDVAVIGRLMGEADLGVFEKRYRAALERVARYYAELFTQGETLGSDHGNLVFTGSDDDPGTLETLTAMGFAEAHKAIETVRKWHYGSYAATRTSAARAHLTELLPALLLTLGRAGNADMALAHFDDFLSRLPGGVQLFALLRNHAQLRTLLVQFMASAPRMAEAVIHRAHVMDGLIDPAFANDVTHRHVLVAKVDAFLAEARSYEDLIDRARIIGQEQKFLVAAGLLSGTVTAHGAGEQFTALAETLLHRLFDRVQDEFAVRHGRIPGAEIAVLAFGKMASGEMTFTSDLDFILLYDAPDTESDGERQLSTPHYFARLTQRLVAAVSAPTAEGVLYEADMRLRPSGNSGPLATSLAGFRAYHKDNAWTWEHLALSRARVIAATGELGRKVDAEIAEVMSRPRDIRKTIEDVISMRALMAKERKPRHAFDLKLAPGGLVDLEFIAQSAQLVAGAQVDLPQATTARVLARLGEIGLVPTGQRLAEIHGVYSTALQVMSSALVSPFKEEAWTPAFKELLAHLSNYPDFGRLELDVAQMQQEVQAAVAEWYDKAAAL
ncbi:bifunctional [glutamine synthetase] adenylyltransferase/[glutamine synthetase]-adenylyl-L-tyrosine phosphorylase [Devosia sp. XJ19-1]|uniref:Bifunctional glutamine synthetase adenylyltransferase/adenylyl-removing enzyme n=1 Tax=Devosia ureilytica TaxID=2952754 RepID=A0A9Q4AQG4_9HYPH|nr:bifunctional [glutamine synthetase] adenylyltransferase/[glutamine synthetase]-adenylyl-L-tyrosine phosphorylase [Devosia ureilytica]MCP8884228.1 bifunctional [glutamine synthetase] adenylyltransferase/[glutamine synthetase]-adenylyl-L-tyrosine phosphorylase [Devosia ureilytica]MCP8887836.1 bifunctional [glutamine synthetase] adenylyltransferase/[glutamine synthetase]-adenylyl-L-tyrosine phosphorylase [Devosia ureilytica]